MEPLGPCGADQLPCFGPDLRRLRAGVHLAHRIGLEGANSPVGGGEPLRQAARTIRSGRVGGTGGDSGARDAWPDVGLPRADAGALARSLRRWVVLVATKSRKSEMVDWS